MPYVDIIHNGRVVGQYYAEDDPQPLKNRYSIGTFIRILTDDEYGIIEETAAGTGPAARRARRILAYWRANGVDCNDSLTAQAITWLGANASGWTPARATAIIG